MKAIRLLIVAAVYVGMSHLGGVALVHDAMDVARPELIKLISNMHPEGGKAFSLITENGGVWENNSRALSGVFKQ